MNTFIKTEVVYECISLWTTEDGILFIHILNKIDVLSVCNCIIESKNKPNMI